MIWEWHARCDKCGHEIEWPKKEWWVRLQSIWHSITKHPYGFMKISMSHNRGKPHEDT